MKYFAERIFHQLFYYRKQYLVIWLELLLGVILLNLCVNRLLTSRALVEKAEEAMGAEEPMLRYHWTGDSWEEAYVPVSYAQYRELERSFSGKLEISFAAWVYDNAFFGENWEETAQWTLVFLNDRLYEEMFGEKRQKNTVYAGEEAEKEIQRAQDGVKNGEVGNWKFKADWKTGTIQLGTFRGSLQRLTDENRGKELETTMLDVYSDETSHVWLKNCVIFPIEWMSGLDLSQENTNCQCTLKVGGADQKQMKNGAEEVLLKLQAQNSNFSYEMVDHYAELESQKEELDWTAFYWLRISFSALLLVGGSLIGLLLVLLHQRRRVKAIAYAMGTTEKYLLAETAAELGTLFGLALVPGLLAAWCININEMLPLTPLQYFSVSNVITSGVIIGIFAAVCVISGRWEGKLSYVQILKGE